MVMKDKFIHAVQSFSSKIVDSPLPVMEVCNGTAPEQLLMLKSDTRKLHRKFLMFNRTEKLMLHHEEICPAGLCS